MKACSTKTLNIFDCVPFGISETSSKNKNPPFAFSKRPGLIKPLYSEPNNTSSIFSDAMLALETETKGSLALTEFA